MRKMFLFGAALCGLMSCSRGTGVLEEDRLNEPEEITLEAMARLLSRLPIGDEQLCEVHDAVSSSSENGYDEEYMMADIFSAPGAGVGAEKADLKTYDRTLGSMIKDYLAANSTTKSGADVAKLVERISEVGMQIYWPYSEDWDGESYPIITFDPGFGAESNYGYEIILDQGGIRVVDSVYVDENVARQRPVWVVNTNDDSAFTPMEMFERSKADISGQDSRKMLILKSFTMLRNYDSWFGGASEFFVKCGSVTGFKASTEAELKNYIPSVTDMMIVVKRKYKGKAYEINSILISDFTDQLENVAFLVTEDDGGTHTSWKCSATVKIKSKSYGFEVDIPYNDKDDIVWRGQLSADYLSSSNPVAARLGDVIVDFSIE